MTSEIKASDVIGWEVLNKGQRAVARFNSKESAEAAAAGWDNHYPEAAPHSVCALIRLPAEMVEDDNG